VQDQYQLLITGNTFTIYKFLMSVEPPHEYSRLFTYTPSASQVKHLVDNKAAMNLNFMANQKYDENIIVSPLYEVLKLLIKPWFDKQLKGMFIDYIYLLIIKQYTTITISYMWLGFQFLHFYIIFFIFRFR